MATLKQLHQADQLVKVMKAPVRGFIIDPVSYPGHYALRFYENQVRGYSTNEKVALAEHLFKLRDAIRSIGIGCEFEGVPGDPPNRR